MVYREFGRTGIQTSLIGFGGMRFDDEAIKKGDFDACADVMVHAYERGVNYFDTAPLYCQDKSREVFARGIKRMDRNKIYVTSKASPGNTGEQNADDMLRSIERDCKMLGVDYIDFFHLWCVLSLDLFREYERMGVIDGILRAKEQGLVRHVSVSTHASGDEIEDILKSGYFEGCLLNYNATNFAFRQKGLEAAKALGIGVAVMNPLGGGLIPRNPDFYSFLKNGPTDTVVKGAVRFNASQPEICTMLIGATKPEHIDEAIEALEDVRPLSPAQMAQMKAHVAENMGSLCTMCGYCKDCPAELPIPKLMDTYNQYLLSGRNPKVSAGRLDMHWDIPRQTLSRCIGCGACEGKCTQHLPIIERIRELREQIEKL